MFGFSAGLSDQAATGPLSVVGGGRGVPAWLIGALALGAFVVVVLWLRKK